MDNRNLGKEVFDRTYDPGFVEGWGVRPYNWSLGLSVQQEVVPRVSVNVGYFRNWWGNWYTVDNRANELADWTPFSIKAPVDTRLPGGGGQTISGLYDLVPTEVGQVDELATNSQELRGADRELAGRRRRRQRAAAERAHGPGRHEHRAPVRGFVRAESGAAGAGPGHARGDDLNRRRLAGEPVLPRGRAVPDVDPWARDLHDSADRCPGQRHVAQRPGRGPRGELRGQQRVHRRERDAWPEPVGSRQRDRQPDRAEHGLFAIGATTSTCASRRFSGSAGRGRRSGSTSTT